MVQKDEEQDPDQIPEDDLTMADLFEQSLAAHQPVVKGTIIKGTLITIRASELLVDIGSKYEGIIRAKDFDRVAPHMLAQLKVGDAVPVFVMQREDEDGYMALSLNKALIEYDWDRAQQVYERGESFQGEVVSANRGGVIVPFGAIQGFVPGSQLAGSSLAQPDPSNPWQAAVGQTLWLKIIEVDRARQRLILSERAAVSEHHRHQREALLAELKEGEVRQGRVSNLADFGAFVDLGGADGLIHVSELAWTPVAHPREVVQIGEEIEVQVLSIDRDRQRIGLSLKRLQPDPWIQAIQSYQVDQVVPAVITRLVDFGAFARLDQVVEGLIHISELAPRRINHPREVVHEGDQVDVCILRIDLDKRRLDLRRLFEIEPVIERDDEADDHAKAITANLENEADEGER